MADKSRLLAHIAESLDYFESFRAVECKDGVMVLDVTLGGGFIIQVQEFEGPDHLKPTPTFPDLVVRPRHETPPSKPLDDDIPF